MTTRLVACSAAPHPSDSVHGKAMWEGRLTSLARYQTDLVKCGLDFNPTKEVKRFVLIARQLYSVLARINDQHTSMRVLVDR